MRAQFIPVRTRDDEQMPIAGTGFRLHPNRQVAQSGAIPLRDTAPAAVPILQSPEFHTQNRGMQFIEPAVLTDDLGRIVLALAVIAEKPALLRKPRIGRDDHSAISVGPKVFRRIETKRRCTPESATSPPTGVAAMSL